jgi:hypothetical protein
MLAPLGIFALAGAIPVCHPIFASIFDPRFLPLSIGASALAAQRHRERGE